MRVIRQAESSADRLAVTAVAHAAMRPEQPREHFQALRLAHPLRAWATWWLLEEDGTPASSLVCYPLDFVRADGRAAGGYGLGAVATHPELRRRGLARALCERVIEDAEASGRTLGLLFSAIAPAYYERLGFRALAAWQHVAAQPAELAASGPRAALRPLDARREAVTLAALYERHHAGTLHLARGAERLLRTLAWNPSNAFYGIGDPLEGYVRVRCEEQELDVLELIVPPHQRAPVLRALAHVAASLSLGRLGGWFAPVPELGAHLRDEGRAKTLPMLRGEAALEGAHVWSSEYF